MTDSAIDSLLESLHQAGRTAHPVYGLPLFGDLNRRDELRELVRKWLAENSPESQR